MQRSQQQALMFLLGAVLVGGVLGFSADRVFSHGARPHVWADRTAMYDDLELSAGQRTQMDSVIDVQHRQIETLLKPVQPQLDSVKANAREGFHRILTPAQWNKFELRRQEEEARRDSVRKAMEQRSR